MKKQNYKSFAVSLFLAAFVLIAANSVFAQSNQLTAEIPFNFHVGNERYAAGNYELRKVKDNLYMLRNSGGTVKALFQTPLTIGSGKEIETEKIVFNRYGNKYFLRQIYTARAGVGRALYESKTEKNARKGFIQELEAGVKVKKGETVEIAVKTK